MRFLFWIFLFLIFACDHKYQSRIVEDNRDYISDFFLASNKEIVKSEDLMIDSLINMSSEEFSKDSSGIRVLINKENISNNLGQMPQDGDLVKVAYNCIVLENVNSFSDLNMLDTDTTIFQIGYSKQIRGMNYAIKLLKIGESAKIIIPSYLGFGVSGYGELVPPYSTLLLNIKLLNLKS